MQAWNKTTILEKLEAPIENKKAVSKMLIALYNKQTVAEQAVGETCEHNGAGFNGVDAGFLSNVAQSSLKYNGNLTDKQAFAVAKKLKKYANQLAKISEEVTKMVEKKQDAKESINDNSAEVNAVKITESLQKPVASKDECVTCAIPNYYGPAHKASRGCQSGGREHCSCDTCF